jgi:hypothetical protein
VMIEFVEFLSGGQLLLALIFTALICIVLGMGLPTTANYIVVSSLMAPVVLALASAEGVVVSLIAVHMFVFYFGILADDTPPVGLAAFAAAAIAQSDPIRTGIQGFIYDIRTAILPFMFIFNGELLLIGVQSWWHLLLVVSSATVAMLLFAAATQGFWLTRSRWWETLGLLLIAFTLFRPGFWWDRLYPPTQTLPASQIIEQAARVPAQGKLQLQVQGETLEGDWVQRTLLLPMGEAGEGEQRLRGAGLELRREEGKVLVDQVVFGSPAEGLGIDFDWEIHALQVAAERPSKYLMLLPALALLGLIGWRQLARRPSL